MDKELKELIDRIEAVGCDCDLLYGRYCVIHKLIEKLKEMINAQASQKDSSEVHS